MKGKTNVKPHERRNSKSDGKHHVSGHTRTYSKRKTPLQRWRERNPDWEYYPEPREDYGDETAYYVLRYFEDENGGYLKLRHDNGNKYIISPIDNDVPYDNYLLERQFTGKDIERIEETVGHKLKRTPHESRRISVDDLISMIDSKYWKLDDVGFHVYMKGKGKV